MFETSSFSRRATVSLAVALCLSACTVGPDFVPPKPVLTAHWQNDSAPHPAQMRFAEWWTVFNDPALNSLIARSSVGGNPDVVSARERVRAARIERRAVSSEGLPTLNGQAAYSRERLATAGVGQVLQPLLGLTPGTTGNEPEGVSYTNYSIGGIASWELDLWGRQRRRQEAANAEFTAIQNDMEAFQLSIQAEIARTYFQWRTVSDDLERAERKLDRAERLLNVAQTVRAHGLLADVALDEQKTLCHTALVERDELSMKRSALHRALAVLVAGRPDDALPELLSVTPLQALKVPEVPAGIPSEIARNRPDIRAAEARLHAATAAIGAAKADFYPQITLTGQFSLDALTVAELGWNARNTSFGPSLSLPIFNGGRLARQLELRQSALRSAGLAYQTTVLNAWVEVENLLANRQFLWAQYKGQVALEAEKTQRMQALEQRYRHGDIAQTELWMTFLSDNQAETELAHTREALLLNEVNLTTALGNSSRAGSVATPRTD